MNLVFGKDAEIAQWVAARIAHAKGGFGLCRSIGVADGIGLVAGVVYSNQAHANLEISCASDSPKWCKPSILKALFHYPFVQLECRRVTCTVPKIKSTARVRKFLVAIGFKYEGSIRELYGKSADGLVFGMLRRECRWLGDEANG